MFILTEGVQNVNDLMSCSLVWAVAASLADTEHILWVGDVADVEQHGWNKLDVERILTPSQAQPLQ